MGAFVAGLMISEVEYADQTLTYVEPLRDIFASLFFAAIGMLIDPVFLWNNLELILGLVAIVFLGKFLIITPLVKLFHYPLKTAIIAGLGLAQIGEFSFVLASEGQSLGLVSRQIYLLILGTTAVTLMLTPFVLRLVPFLFNFAESMPWLKLYLEEQEALDVSEDLPFKDHVVVCGYGRVGKNLVKLLLQHDLPVVVIDQSESRIQQLREAGVSYVYGNCVSLHVLETAGVNHAKGMAIALPDPMSTRLCLKRALELCPELDLVVRATQDKNIEVLYQLGAREVVQPEFEASLEMATYLLTGLGLLSLAVVQREMQQIRNDHYLELRPERSATEVARDLRQATLDLNQRWYPLPSASPLIGMSIEEADMRYLTGASLMAIRRANGDEIDYPNNQTKLEDGDRLLVVGADEELAALAEFAKGQAAVPGENSACQWITVNADAPTLVGKTLADLDISKQFGVQVQAIRRDGKFIRYPDGGMDLRVGDQALLCGSLTGLSQLEQLFAIASSVPLSLPAVKAAKAEALKEFLPTDNSVTD
jgi:CPA2 family monovalent cation:H+ antiporter-2